MPGVVADGVTVSEDLFDKFRIAFQKCADDEERCRSLMFRKSFQNPIAYRTIFPADFFFCKKYSYGDALY